MAKVYLSPSTQERNIGIGKYGTEEYRCNLVADVTERELKRHGVDIKRNTPDMTLYEVVTDSNNFNPDLHQAIHTNAYNGKARGCEVFCWELSKNLMGEKLANNIYLNIAKITPTSDRGVKAAKDFYGPGKHMFEIAKTKAPASLIEIAFHDNIYDAAWIIANIELIGVEIAKGILKTLQIDYIEEVPEVEGTVYRVIAGSFKNKDNALSYSKVLNSKGIANFIEMYEIE